MYVEKWDDGLLALLLARQAVFGAAVMAKCTPLEQKQNLSCHNVNYNIT